MRKNMEIKKSEFVNENAVVLEEMKN